MENTLKGDRFTKREADFLAKVKGMFGVCTTVYETMTDGEIVEMYRKFGAKDAIKTFKRWDADMDADIARAKADREYYGETDEEIAEAWAECARLTAADAAARMAVA